MKAPIAALSSLALAVGLFAWLVPSGEVQHGMWLFIYLALAASSVYAWRHANAPAKPTGWLKLGAAVGGVIAAMAAVEYFIIGPKSGIVILDALLVPATLLVAITGAVYSAFKQKPA